MRRSVNLYGGGRLKYYVPLCVAGKTERRRKPNFSRGYEVANIKSQMKRIRTNEKARLRNQAVKSELKTYVRQAREAIAAGEKETAEAKLRVATRKLDVAASKGIIHKNQAAQRKSKLAAQVAAL